MIHSSITYNICSYAACKSHHHINTYPIIADILPFFQHFFQKCRQTCLVHKNIREYNGCIVSIMKYQKGLFMKKFPFQKIKQILAILGVIVLVGLYAATLICALSKSDNYMNLLMASVYSTVIIPVLIWAYSFIYKLLKNYYSEKNDTKENTNEDTKEEP